jgi:hypothetical protein
MPPMYRPLMYRPSNHQGTIQCSRGASIFPSLCLKCSQYLHSRLHCKGYKEDSAGSSSAGTMCASPRPSTNNNRRLCTARGSRVSNSAACLLLCRSQVRFMQCVAAYQLLVLVSLMEHPQLSPAVPGLTESLLAAFANPMPFAQTCAAHALLHMCQHATAAALYAHEGSLMAAVSASLTACDASVWPSMLPCAIDLSTRLDSVSGGHERRASVLSTSIMEAERSSGEGAVWGPWLTCLSGQGRPSGSFLQAFGLELLRHSSRLFPLLLERLLLLNEDEVPRICKV